MTLALPLRLEGAQIHDANGRQIALVRGLMDEYRAHGAEIVSAVNSHDDLLAAAKWAVSGIKTEDTPTIAGLRAAIEKAEQA